MYQQRPSFQKRDPYSNTYNEGWRDHPNFRWGGGGTNAPNRFQGGQGSQNVNPNVNAPQGNLGVSQPSTSSNENLGMVNMMETMMAQLKQMEAKYDNLSTFVSQLANAKSDEEAKKGGLPSNTVVNPRALHAITLRSGKELQSDRMKPRFAQTTR